MNIKVLSWELFYLYLSEGHQCMEAISVEDVFNAAINLLQSRVTEVRMETQFMHKIDPNKSVRKLSWEEYMLKSFKMMCYFS